MIREIGGVEIDIRNDGESILVDVGGVLMEPAEIESLRPAPDWTDTVEIGPYAFCATALAELRAFVRDPHGGAARGESDEALNPSRIPGEPIPTPDAPTRPETAPTYAELTSALRRLLAASRSTVGDYRPHKEGSALLARADEAPPLSTLFKSRQAGASAVQRAELSDLVLAILHRAFNIRVVGTLHAQPLVHLDVHPHYYTTWWICDNGGELNVRPVNRDEDMRSIPYTAWTSLLDPGTIAYRIAAVLSDAAIDYDLRRPELVLG